MQAIKALELDLVSVSCNPFTTEREKSPRKRSRLLPESNKLSCFVLRDGILYRGIMFTHNSSVTWQLILLRAQARSVAGRIHIEVGHWGFHKAFTLFKRQAMFVGLFQLVEQVCVVEHCVVCSMLKGSEVQIPYLIWHTSAPPEVLTIIFSTLDMSENGYHHFLVMVDCFINFMAAILSSG